MIIFILGGILGASMGVVLIIGQDGIGDIIAGVVFTVVFGAFGLLLGGGIASFIGYAFPQRAEPSDRYELVALRDNIGMSGSFFLGTGSIDQEITYFFYRKEGTGFKADKVSNAVIFEDEETQPYVQKYDSEFKNSFWDIFVFPMKEYPTEIHIPKGSILQNYTLNLK